MRLSTRTLVPCRRTKRAPRLATRVPRTRPAVGCVAGAAAGTGFNAGALAVGVTEVAFSHQLGRLGRPARAAAVPAPPLRQGRPPAAGRGAAGARVLGAVAARQPVAAAVGV